MKPVSADLVWQPGQIVVLDERLTDVASYVRRHEVERLVRQLSWLLDTPLLDDEGAA